MRILHPQRSKLFLQPTRTIWMSISTVLAHKRATTSKNAADCQKGSIDPSLISQRDLQACNDELNTMGDNASFDNCRGSGAVTQSGPILALDGTSSVELCGDTERCI